MSFVLLIVEPLGQRAERGREAGEQVYQRMLDFSAELEAQGILRGVSSLGARSQRLQRRAGQTQLIDGPFAEAKEMVGGFFWIDVPTREEALAIAARCPAAEWATVEVRGTGPCFED
ncbi:YciI family protein [Paucibacter sp. APW11]|uniref:YciI family protein n=1 Tax=Roseateles aquae TaxID=3077235 RepID=A0ABU3PIS7_9BURK|nr:YciI family protein [Paucibacter sp. APW11]MDT9002460.1 YciI family protein [Paucibacter sp. APW11]